MPLPKEFPRQMNLANVEFELLDPREHGGKSCLMLEPDHSQLPQIARGDYVPQATGLAVGRRFDRFYSLHAAAWAKAATGSPLWKYVLHYRDGTSVDIPVRMGLEVADWYRPQRLPNAKVGWTGSSLKLSPIGLYVAGFDNPYPDKEVTSLDIVSAKASGIPGIIALSTAVKVEGR